MTTSAQSLRERRFQDGLFCPHCKGRSVIRCGFERSRLQRYRCKNCGLTFNERTGTPMARTKLPDKWESFAVCMRESKSCRETASRLGINHKTAFYWRHKVLAVLESQLKPKLTGVVEADETVLRHSDKGKRGLPNPRKRAGVKKNGQPRGMGLNKVFVMVARNREKLTSAYVMDKVTARAVNRAFDQSIEPSVFCSDGSSALRAYARRKGVEHHVIKSNDLKAKQGVYHIQNVNAYHSRFGGWLLGFHGVATRYLSHYTQWHIFLEQSRGLSHDDVANTLLATPLALRPRRRVRRCQNCGAPIAEVATA
jgi:transposase-like protein